MGFASSTRERPRRERRAVGLHHGEKLRRRRVHGTETLYPSIVASGGLPMGKSVEWATDDRIAKLVFGLCVRHVPVAILKGLQDTAVRGAQAERSRGGIGARRGDRKDAVPQATMRVIFLPGVCARG
jgi:hypothetical protein